MTTTTETAMDEARARVAQALATIERHMRERAAARQGDTTGHAPGYETKAWQFNRPAPTLFERHLASKKRMDHVDRGLRKTIQRLRQLRASRATRRGRTGRTGWR